MDFHQHRASLVERRSPPVDARLRLARREFQTWELLALGFTRKEIGAALGISVKTIEKYLERLQRKLGVKGMVCLARAAIAYGIVAVPRETRGYVVNGKPKAAPISVLSHYRGLSAAR